MNGKTSYGEVGIGVSSAPPVGFTHTVFDLLSPDFFAGAIDCAGPGTAEYHDNHHPCTYTPCHPVLRNGGQFDPVCL